MLSEPSLQNVYGGELFFFFFFHVKNMATLLLMTERHQKRNADLVSEVGRNGQRIIENEALDVHSSMPFLLYASLIPVDT